MRDHQPQLFQLIARDGALDVLNTHLRLAQERTKKYVDKKRRENFEVGDHVFLKLRPDGKTSLAKRRNEKLTPNYFGLALSMRRSPLRSTSYSCQMRHSSTLFVTCPS